MPGMTLSDLSKKMADLDFAMLSTRTENGAIASRPMSNNGEVGYEGDSYYFSYDSARTISDIEADPKVGLTFQGSRGVLGMRPFMVAVEGRADLVRDKSAFEAHWTKDLDRWFEDGVDTAGLVLIHVRAERIHYWDGTDEGEVTL